MDDPRLDPLLTRLASPDARVSRQAGDELLRLGPPAVAPLLGMLREGPAEGRKAASFLLGRLAGSRSEVRAGLTAALRDDEPKVRKNAAVALGRLAADLPPEEAEGTARALAAALEGESIPWVRSSLVLALGSAGGSAARTALAAAEPASAEEGEALRKARDRVLEETPEVAWRDDAPPLPGLWAAAPPGLEDVARAEAVEAGFAVELAGPGLLRLPPDVRPDRLLRRLRCIYGLRILVAEGPSLHRVPQEALAERVGELLSGAAWLPHWRRWIDPGDGGGEDGSGGEVLRYRFALDELRVRKATFFAVLAAARQALGEHGLRDSPSHYALQVTVEAAPEVTRVWVLPTFLPDERFAYRLEDVGASIHPVVAACLARLVSSEPPAGEEGEDEERTLHIVDPTCGSGTLLVERAKLSPGVELLGMDVSPTAVRAAERNLEAAGLAGRSAVHRADARDERAWRDLLGGGADGGPAGQVDELLANLPFGVRSRGTDPQRSDDQDETDYGDALARLYDGVMAQLSRRLAPGGRAVLYTANRNLLHGALRRARQGIRFTDERTTESGGLRVGVWVLERDPPR